MRRRVAVIDNMMDTWMFHISGPEKILIESKKQKQKKPTLKKPAGWKWGRLELLAGTRLHNHPGSDLERRTWLKLVAEY